MRLPPYSFTWIERGKLGALARPESREDLSWLRDEGVEVLLSLTEDPIRKDWLEDAGLLVMHVPVPDMEAPTEQQLEQCVSAIRKANAQGMGVAVHCTAGLGRTGSILAAYFVSTGMNAEEAMAKVRELRPGSIETEKQEAAIQAFARKRGMVGKEAS